MGSINVYPEFSKNNPFGSQAKMLYHMDRLQEYLQHGDTHPIFMEVNLTDVCNMACYWCISENRNSYTLDPKSLMKFIVDFKRMGGKALTFSGGGEPTLYKHFKEAVMTAHNNGIDLGLMTNGFFSHNKVDLIGNHFKWIRISIDTVNKKNFKEWKGVDCVDKILENLKALSQYDIKIGINCNVNNEMSVYDTRKLIETVRDYCTYIQFRPILPRYFKEETIQLNNTVWNFLEDNYKGDPKINFSYDKFKDLKHKNYFPFDKCEGHFFSPILDANGDVKVCIYHPGDSDFSFGNINEKSFEEIWNSEQRKKAIEHTRKFDYNKCQMCCKLYELNKMIDFIKNPSDEMDINFL